MLMEMRGMLSPVAAGAATAGFVAWAAAGATGAAVIGAGGATTGASAGASAVCASNGVEREASTAAIAVMPGRSGVLACLMPVQLRMHQ